MSDDAIEKWMTDDRLNDWPIVHRSSIIDSQLQSSIIDHPVIYDHRQPSVRRLPDWPSRETNSVSRALTSGGLIRWKSKPTLRERLRSASCPHPVRAMSVTAWDVCCCRIRRATS